MTFQGNPLGYEKTQIFDSSNIPSNTSSVSANVLPRGDKKMLASTDTLRIKGQSPPYLSQGGPQIKEGVCETPLPTDDGKPLWDQKRPTYPFTAIVGQEEMKLALLLNVIDPKIGGVMIMGDRGTGKSTTVRALVDLLPTINVVDNDPFNSHPSDAELMSQNVREQVLQGKTLKVVSKKTTMIDLPLGATEDRVCGTIDIERALSEGVKAFEPGLLAKANRGILYVDEVNLLDDHLVDILLDSAASGWNTVEREGISISHPARFILVGSGNPEEGELRPQLLDRFGMHAQIGTVREAELRVKIVEERASFDRSPLDFLKTHQKNQKELADKIVAARHILGAVKIDYDLRVKISHVCGQLNVDGLRGDIVTNRASQALAAFEARTTVTPQDIFRVIPLCLRHRLRKDPLEPIDSGDRVREIFKQVFGFFSE
jgi:magnesium chelatase subunit I